MDKRVALVGYGYWGPNLLRNLFDNSGCEVVYCCDKDQNKLKAVKKRYPSIEVTTDFDQVVKDSTIHGIVLATPTITHFPLAKKAAEHGKDVLIEKPMTLDCSHAWQLVKVARKHKRILMVDHTFLFNDAVTRIKEIIDGKELGDILYIDSVRVNLGLFQKDSNVIFDLATHDFSIINYLLGAHPKSVYAHGRVHFGQHEDVAYVFAEYLKNISASVHISWLSPAKIRRMLIVGTKKMIVYDDIEPTEKVRIYDKGVIIPKKLRELEDAKIGYRTGDVWLPKVNVVEPLSLLVQDFLNAIETRKEPKSSGTFGAQIVEILESATKSARTGRKVVFDHARR
ncbi:Gfo/Idh/MocA family oxidoreductase [Candidatus Microgenomates bacterium]|nr:Gfo/Idh/MocA family oxidoreductase [Candidatus Microgenomates bacterium]